MRPIGMAAGPIPYDRIVWYAQHHGFTETDTTILIRVIRAMDSGYLDAERRKRAAAK